MNSPRLLSALFSALVGCLLLVSGCAQPTSTNPTGGGITCGAGQMACGMECRNVATDNSNCGMCGRACGSTQVCQAGACVCAAGLMMCGGSCVGQTAQSCGASCTVCPSGQSCTNGTCGSCSSPMIMCPDGACVAATGDGTIAHCGGCTACTGGTACVNNACTCAAGLTMCGGSCVDTKVSNAHCGNCNTPCNGTCVNGSCMMATGQGGAGGATGGGGRGGSGTPGTAGSAGSGPAGAGGGAAGRGGSGPAGAGGGAAGTTGTGGNPPGWWTSGSFKGCPWTGIDTLSGSMTTNMPREFITKTDNFTTPYCVSGSVTPDPSYNGVALLGFNLNETPTGTATQCAYKAANPNAVGPPSIQVTGAGIAVSFTKTVGSVLRIQIQDEMGGMLPPIGDLHRWCYTITEPQGPVFAAWEKFNTKCWDNTGNAFRPTMDRVSAVVFGVPGEPIPQRFGYCIGGFAFGSGVSAAPTYNPNPYPRIAGTIGGAGHTDLDFQRVKVAAPGAGGKQYIIQNNNWGARMGGSDTNQSISYDANTFRITGETGGSPGGGIPASYPSIYIGNNGNTQNKNDPPKGSYTTSGNDNLPRQISAIGSAMTTAAYSGGSLADSNASYDIWVSSNMPTSMYEDALSGFVMVWLHKPGNRNPIGTNIMTKTIDNNSYQIWAGRRGSGTNPERPVISYVLTTSAPSKTFNLKPILMDAANNYGGYSVPSNWYVTDIFFGFEIWTGTGTNGLSVTNFTVDVQ